MGSTHSNATYIEVSADSYIESTIVPTTASTGIPASVEKQVNTKLLVPYLSVSNRVPLVPAVIDIIRSGKYDPRVPVDADNRSLTMLAIKLYVKMVNSTERIQMHEIMMLVTKACVDSRNTHSLYHRDRYGRTVLHYIALIPFRCGVGHDYLEEYYTWVRKMATPYRAIINEQSHISKGTALMVAAGSYQTRVLLELGAAVGIFDDKGNTVLHLMYHGRCPLTHENTRLIVDRAYSERVNIMAPNNDGKTPMDLLVARKDSIPISDYQSHLFELNRAIEMMKHIVGATAAVNSSVSTAVSTATS